MNITAIKKEVFRRHHSLGLDTVRRYVNFIVNAPEKDIPLRDDIIQTITGEVSDEELAEIELFLKQ